MAPQVIRGGGWGKNKVYYDGFKADIWSLGVMIYYALTFKYPFDGENAQDYMWNVCEADVEFRPLPDNTPDIWKQLVPRMLDKDEHERISAEELLMELCGEYPSEHKTKEQIEEASLSWKYEINDLP